MLERYFLLQKHGNSLFLPYIWCKDKKKKKSVQQFLSIKGVPKKKKEEKSKNNTSI